MGLARAQDKRRTWRYQVTDNIPTYPDNAGKVAVVTGGSGGIGAATCRLLAANGVTVAVNGRDENSIEATVEAVAAPADCTDPTAIEAMRRWQEAGSWTERNLQRANNSAIRR
jgi:NAD(P)-dependent dehydrogenase (short-subunit alcohol dehydrogenase family)